VSRRRRVVDDARYAARSLVARATTASGAVAAACSNLFSGASSLRPRVVAAILKDECRAVLADFFRTLRS